MNEVRIAWDSEAFGRVDKAVAELALYTELNRLPVLLVSVHTAQDPTGGGAYELSGQGEGVRWTTTWYPISVQWSMRLQIAVLVLSPLATARAMSPVVENDFNAASRKANFAELVPGERAHVRNQLDDGGAFDQPIPWALSVNEGAETWLRRLSEATGGVWSMAPEEDGVWALCEVSTKAAPADGWSLSEEWLLQGTQSLWAYPSFDLLTEMPGTVPPAQREIVYHSSKSTLDWARPFAWAGQWMTHPIGHERQRVVASIHAFDSAHGQPSTAAWQSHAWLLREGVASDAPRLARALFELAPMCRAGESLAGMGHLAVAWNAIAQIRAHEDTASRWPPAIAATVKNTVEPALSMSPDLVPVYERTVTVEFPWAADRPFRLPMVLPMSGAEGGAFFAPATGDLVFVHFMGASPLRPFTLGAGRLAFLSAAEKQSEAVAHSAFVDGTSLSNGMANYFRIPAGSLQGTVRGIQVDGPLVLKGNSILIEADALVLKCKVMRELSHPELD